MKHLPSTLAFICAALTAALPVAAESLRDAVADAERLIIQKYETPVARQMAMEDLNAILKSNMTNEEKIAAIHAEFLSEPSPSIPVQDNSAQSDNPVGLIYRPPLQWEIQSIEIAYDIDSVTNLLFSAESLYQEGNSKSREDTTGSSHVTNFNAGAKTQLDVDVGGDINIKGWNPLKWFSAKAGYQWVTSNNAGINYTKTKSSQWNERAQRALSNNYEEKARILRDTRITKCHLTFYVLFKNNTDKDLLLDPQEFSIPVYAGANRPLADAVPDTRLRSFRIPRNAYSDLKFRAELNTTSALNLINYMRTNEPMIRLDRAQSTIISSDGSIQNAVQDSIQVETVPFRCRDFELQIKKENLGKTTTVADAMHALNSIFEKTPFGFNQDGDCISLIEVPLVKNGEIDMDIHRVPTIGFNGSFTSAVIPAAQLNRPLTDEGLSIDVLDVLAGDTWDNSSYQLQAFLIPVLRSVAETGDATAQNLLGVCYHRGDGVSENAEEAVKWYRKAAEQGFAKAQYNLACQFYNGKGVSKDDAEAVKWYRLAAEQGFAPAQVALGGYYAKGVGVQQNDTEAVKWYRLAAEQGDADAQTILGGFYLEGIGVPKNDAEAVKWFRKAAEQGSALAQAALGDCILQGIGVQKNEEEAVKWYRKAAEQGSALAQAALGDCYAKGVGVSQNDAEAVKWYRLAAEQGFAPAQAALGGYYAKGVGVQQNDTEAVKWYRKAAEQGVAPAQLILGDCYSDGVGVQQNDTEAVKWYRKAAEQGLAMAQYWLGASYYTGSGVLQSDAEAAKWHRLAAEQGLDIAQAALGDCFLQGIGVSQNYAEAVKWYRKAAEQGFAPAQAALGDCYANGIEVQKNDTEAVKWYRKAAEQGFAPAQAELGCYYHEGIGVQKNYSEAVRWFRLSAEQDYFRGQYLLGVAYEKGDGVSRNKSEAAKWYRLAAKQGFEDAQEALNRLGN